MEQQPGPPPINHFAAQVMALSDEGPGLAGMLYSTNRGLGNPYLNPTGRTVNPNNPFLDHLWNGGNNNPFLDNVRSRETNNPFLPPLSDRESRNPFLNPQLQLHRYDQPPSLPAAVPPTRPTNSIELVPRQPREEIPVITEVMNTINEAQNRKRRADEELYTNRHVGSQTGMEEVQVLSAEVPISQNKRFRVTEPREPREVATDNAETNTELIILSDMPSTSQRTRPLSPASRQARRIRRALRNHQETQRMVEQHEQHQQHMQEVNGLVPGTAHNCDTNCMHNTGPFYHFIHRPGAPAPLAPANLIPPAVAPMVHPPPQTVAATYQAYLPGFSTLPHISYLMGIVIPPVPPLPALSALPAPVPIRPTPAPPPPPGPHVYNPYSFQATYPDYMADVLRNPYQLDNRQLFAGLEIDVPIGATKREIGKFTVPMNYSKESEKEETCTVCLSDFEENENIRKLRCNHIFHPECIEKWLDINKKCPMCRKEIDNDPNAPPAQYRPLPRLMDLVAPPAMRRPAHYPMPPLPMQRFQTPPPAAMVIDVSTQEVPMRPRSGTPTPPEPERFEEFPLAEPPRPRSLLAPDVLPNTVPMRPSSGTPEPTRFDPPFYPSPQYL